MYSFCAMYSLRMSFWSVPRELRPVDALLLGDARYIASRIAAGELMVIDIVTWPSGMPSNRISMSSSESTATPHADLAQRPR